MARLISFFPFTGDETVEAVVGTTTFGGILIAIVGAVKVFCRRSASVAKQASGIAPVLKNAPSKIIGKEASEITPILKDNPSKDLEKENK